jgi:hypothetical protein
MYRSLFYCQTELRAAYVTYFNLPSLNLPSLSASDCVDWHKSPVEPSPYLNLIAPNFADLFSYWKST